MTPAQEPVRHPYPQSVDDLTRHQVIWETLCSSRPKVEGAQIRRDHKERLEDLGDHPLAPAMGIINGLRLSVILWSAILLGVVLIQ